VERRAFCCLYNDGTLRFNYTAKGDIIRIIVHSSYGGIIQLKNGMLNMLTKNEILNNLDRKEYFDMRNTVSYYDADTSIQYCYWFNEQGLVTWYDMYIERPWD
jgi:hypothetical protein